MTWKIVPRTEGSDGIAMGSLRSQTGSTTYDSGLVTPHPPTPLHQRRHNLHDGDEGICATRIPVRADGEKSPFIEVSLYADLRRLPTMNSAEKSHPGTRAKRSCTRTSSGSRRLPAQRPPDAVMSSAVNAHERVLPGSLDPFDDEQSRPPSGWRSCPRSGLRVTRRSVVSRSVPDNSMTLVGTSEDDVRPPRRAPTRSTTRNSCGTLRLLLICTAITSRNA